MESLLKAGWNSKEGLQRALLASASIYTGVFFFSKNGLDFAISTSSTIAGGLTFFFLAGYYFAWKYKRSILVMRKKINIYFCYYFINNNEAVRTTFERFQHRISERLMAYKLDNDISVTFLPTDIKISSDDQAQAMIRGYVGHTLLVWGNLENIGGEVKVYNNQTKLTYEYNIFHPKGYTTKKNRDFFEKINKDFNRDINISQTSLDWRLDLTKETNFLEYVNNIYSVSLLTIARILISADEFEKAANLLETNKKNISLLPQNEMIKHSIVKEKTNFYLGEIYANFANDAFIPAENLEKIERYSTLALQNNPKSYSGNMIMAFVADKKYRNLARALKFTEEATKNSKGRGNTHLFNKAYLALKSKEYSKALYIYRKLLKDGTNANLGQIIGYIEDEYGRSQLSEMRFAIGYLSVTWKFDLSNGVKELKKFIHDTNDKVEEYEQLRLEAIKVISKFR